MSTSCPCLCQCFTTEESSCANNYSAPILLLGTFFKELVTKVTKPKNDLKVSTVLIFTLAH